MRIYLAAPIFSEADRMYNDLVADRIIEAFPNVDIYVPHRNKAINDKKLFASSLDICKGDFTDNLDHDDIVVALVDGNVCSGIGTVLECGYFSRICQEEINRFGSTKKKIISLYTDSRECSSTFLDEKIDALHEIAENQFAYLNLLLVGALKRYGVMCRTIDGVIEQLRIAIEEYEEDNIGGECHNDL